MKFHAVVAWKGRCSGSYGEDREGPLFSEAAIQRSPPELPEVVASLLAGWARAERAAESLEGGRLPWEKNATYAVFEDKKIFRRVGIMSLLELHHARVEPSSRTSPGIQATTDIVLAKSPS